MSTTEREREALHESYALVRAAGRRAAAAAACQTSEHAAPATTPSGVSKSHQGGTDAYNINPPS